MYPMFSLCWPLTTLCHISNEKGAFLLMFPPLLPGPYFFSPLYVYLVFKLKNIHTRHSYDSFVHHSVAPIILVRVPWSNNIFDPGMYNIQTRDYPQDFFYS
jgi:hypothetical protein